MKIKKVFFIGAYVIFLFLAIVIADNIYARFENIPFQHCKIRMFTWGNGRFAFKVSKIPGLVYEMVPNSKIKYLETNSIGIRAKEYKIPKPLNTFRIIILGDSVSHGKFIEQKDVFSTLLEEKLNNGLHEIVYEVINASVPGYNTMQEYIAFINKWYVYKPDLLLVCFNPSDLMPTLLQLDNYKGLVYSHIAYKPTKKNEGFNTSIMNYPQMLSISMPNLFNLPGNLHRELILHSSIYRLITVRSYDYLSKRNKYKYPPQAYLNFVNIQAEYAISQLKSYCENNRIDLIFVFFPYLYDKAPATKDDMVKIDSAKEMLEAKSVTYIDILPYFKVKVDTVKKIALDSQNGDYTHLNALGHKFTADAIYDYLMKYFKNKEFLSKEENECGDSEVAFRAPEWAFL